MGPRLERELSRQFSEAVSRASGSSAREGFWLFLRFWSWGRVVDVLQEMLRLIRERSPAMHSEVAQDDDDDLPIWSHTLRLYPVPDAPRQSEVLHVIPRTSPIPRPSGTIRVLVKPCCGLIAHRWRPSSRATRLRRRAASGAKVAKVARQQRRTLRWQQHLRPRLHPYPQSPRPSRPALRRAPPTPSPLPHSRRR
jgi:hypothetical protein